MKRAAFAALLIASLCSPRFPPAQREVTAPPPVAVASPSTTMHGTALPQSWGDDKEPSGQAVVAVDEGTAPTFPAAPALTYREQVLHELRLLGAAEWIVASLDCLGWRESGWQNIRSHRANTNGTFDHGGLQINDSNVRRFGLDPYVPASQAFMAYQLVLGRLRIGDPPFADWSTRC